MKPFILSTLILIGIFQAQTLGIFDLHSKSFSTEKNDQILPKNDECLAEFIGHSLNLLDKTPENTCTREMIARYGKNEIFEPALLSYVFLIEKGTQDITKFESTKEGVVMNFNVCVDTKSEDCLLQRLFNKSDASSLVSKQKRLFGNEKLSYLYTTQPFIMEDLNSHSMSLFLTKDKKVSFVDGEGKTYNSFQTLSSCANELLKNQYEFTDEAVYKYRSELQISINEQNKKEIELLMKDLCTLNQFSKMIRNDGKPNFFAFYIQSINHLNKILKPNEMTMVQEMWLLTKSKFISYLQKKYMKEELFGGQFFVESELKPTFSTEFPAISSHTARILDTTTTNTSTTTHFANDAHYEAYVWTPVVLTFVVFFSVMALLTMDFSKDTLLYAKFLTNDAR